VDLCVRFNLSTVIRFGRVANSFMFRFPMQVRCIDIISNKFNILQSNGSIFMVCQQWRISEKEL
jgi:hypothetical protein